MTRTLLALALALAPLLHAPAGAEEHRELSPGEAISRTILQELARQRLEEQEAARQRYTHTHGRFGTHDHAIDEDHDRAHADDRRGAMVAPERCFRDFDGPAGGGRGFDLMCMERRVERPDLLPLGCLRRIETRRGGEYVFGGRCLGRQGWVREAGGRWRDDD